ncbi:hypothetical protein V8949_05110 [Klebsiella pneumoniae]
MKARQKRRQRRITTANVTPSVRLAGDDPLMLLQQLLTEQRRPFSPDIMPELEKSPGRCCVSIGVLMLWKAGLSVRVLSPAV